MKFLLGYKKITVIRWGGINHSFGEYKFGVRKFTRVIFVSGEIRKFLAGGGD